MHFSSLILKCWCPLFPSPIDHFQFTLIHEHNILGSCSILFFAASNYTFATKHNHTRALFLFWLRIFIPSGLVSLLFSRITLASYWPREFIFQCHIFVLFPTVHGVPQARMLVWFAIPFSVGHIWSEPSIITYLSWVALHGMTHSFTDLDKAVIHVPLYL